MNESYITVHGYVVAPPVLRTVGEHQVANFRIGVTPRKLERSSGEWRDAETQWYSVSAWRALGDNVARSLRKGDPVIVQGRLSARTWVNAHHSEVIAHDIEATVVGHDLRRGVTTFAKTVAGVVPAPEAAPRPDPYAGSDRAGEQPAELSNDQVESLIDGTAEPTTDAPVPAATRTDWNAPLQDAPDWAGAA